MIITNPVIVYSIFMLAVVGLIDVSGAIFKILRRLIGGERNMTVLIAQLFGSKSKLTKAILLAHDDRTEYVIVSKETHGRIQNLRVLSENVTFGDVVNNSLDLYELLHQKAADGYTDIELIHPYQAPELISLDVLQKPRKRSEEEEG